MLGDKKYEKAKTALLVQTKRIILMGVSFVNLNCAITTTTTSMHEVGVEMNNLKWIKFVLTFA